MPPSKPTVQEPEIFANTQLISVLCNSNRTSSAIATDEENNFYYISGQNLITLNNEGDLASYSQPKLFSAVLNCISVSEVGLAIGLADGSIYIERGPESQILKLSDDAINAISMSNTGFVTASDINSGVYIINSENQYIFVNFRDQNLHVSGRQSPFYNSIVICMATFENFGIFGLDNGNICVFDLENLTFCCQFQNKHEDWVRSVDVKPTEESENQLQILSGGQDKKMMITKLDLNQKTTQVLQIFEDHEALVYTTKWIQDKFLLSTSMDGTMLIYKFDEIESKFIEIHKVGQLHASNQHVGFWSACVATDLTTGNARIKATTYTGAFYEWILDSTSDSDSPDLTESEINMIGGHMGRTKVNDIVWSNGGSHLFSCGSDMTTRGYSFDGRQFCRPQVFGYELNRLSCLDTESNEFVSCSEEKEMRVFAPTGGE